MNRLLIVVSFFTACIFFACTPYDSNKKNIDLLQGRWMMTNLYHVADDDSTLVPESISPDSIILSFVGNEYIEYLTASQRQYNLTYDIYNYKMILYKNGTISDWFDIDVLTPDSLVLGKLDYKWQYKKIE